MVWTAESRDASPEENESYRHWSFIPPSYPAVPEVQRADWVASPIDAFVAARLEKEELQPSPRANKLTLLRRVTLDLTGLPPTPDEIEAFLADDSPDAYLRLVDRLLISPRFGERMAVTWLDVARYADTNGYQQDMPRTQWNWRDWVIGAYNRNVPFDQFTIEQLASLLRGEAFARVAQTQDSRRAHFAPHAKRVIYLFQSGAPSQIDLFDHKPGLEKVHGTELPDSVRGNQRLTGMTSGQKSFPVTKPIAPFRPFGRNRVWLSTMLPWTGRIVDEICLIRSMHTEAINHDSGITYFQTGSQQPGKPSLGAWVSYGLGSQSQNLPAFVVLISKNTYDASQPLYSRLWGSGFLPSNYQGVKFRSSGDLVLYLNDPSAASLATRRRLLDAVTRMNELRASQVGDPEIQTRIAAYEMAYRMQMSVPELTDLSDEPASTFALYGQEARQPGTHAANCLLARRLAERGVRFIQLYHRGWDNHVKLPEDHPRRCAETDRGSAALVLDLKRRGMLDDTLVIWGGEFGRTIYAQGKLEGTGYGRDHHPRCFTMWLAGGGIKPGIVWGQTDDYCYNIVRDPVHIHELNATILHCLGLDHMQLTYEFQGLDQRLTGVEKVHPVTGVLA